MDAVMLETMFDFEGFDSRYDALFRELTALARALGAGSEAEDVAQEALVEARRQLGQLRDPEKLEAWVRRIAVRGACRARQRHLELLDEELVERLPAADLPDCDLPAAIASLPERERLAITLVFGLGFRQDEAADLMGVAPGTVYASVWRAKRKLARLLAADEPAGGIDVPAGRGRAGR